MTSAITYKCPNCDAGLIFKPERQKFVCDFCISEFTEEELKNTDAQRRAEKQEAEDYDFSVHTRQYCCSSCGAEIITDDTTVADTCCYCHNPIVMSERVSGVEKPSKIIPFKFGKDEAKDIFLRFAKKKRFAPKHYASRENAEKISGVYYPFWVVDADTLANADYSANKVRSWRMGDYRYTEISHYKLRRLGNIHFEDITSSAIFEEDKEMLEGILPYPTDCHIDFSMPYLQGFVAKKKNIDRAMLTPEVRGKMESYASQLLRSTVSGYASVDESSFGMMIDKSHWEYTLMPVWILTYNHKGKRFTYAMNGNTGKVYGRIPLSIPKLLLLFGGSFILTLIITMLFGFFVF